MLKRITQITTAILIGLSSIFMLIGLVLILTFFGIELLPNGSWPNAVQQTKLSSSGGALMITGSSLGIIVTFIYIGSFAQHMANKNGLACGLNFLCFLFWGIVVSLSIVIATSSNLPSIVLSLQTLPELPEHVYGGLRLYPIVDYGNHTTFIGVGIALAILSTLLSMARAYVIARYGSMQGLKQQFGTPKQYQEPQQSQYERYPYPPQEYQSEQYREEYQQDAYVDRGYDEQYREPNEEVRY